MTGHAIGRRPGVTRSMAGKAIQGAVSPRQRKCRRIVVEGGGLPGRGRVTGPAIGWKNRRKMIGIRGAIIVILVADNAIGRRACKTVRVTCHAFQKTMRARQWKRGRVEEVPRAPS